MGTTKNLSQKNPRRNDRHVLRDDHLDKNSKKTQKNALFGTHPNTPNKKQKSNTIKNIYE